MKDSKPTVAHLFSPTYYRGSKICGAQIGPLRVTCNKNMNDETHVAPTVGSPDRIWIDPASNYYRREPPNEEYQRFSYLREGLVGELREALEDIAKQRLTNEIEPIDGEICGDFEGAYDIMIQIARTALKPFKGDGDGKQ